jgi:hypothetical protein
MPLILEPPKWVLPLAGPFGALFVLTIFAMVVV